MTTPLGCERVLVVTGPPSVHGDTRKGIHKEVSDEKDSKTLRLRFGLRLAASFSRGPAGPDLLLLTKYRPGMDIAGWYMSEKLDGVRAYWNGRELLSRTGNRFAAPHWFTAGFPSFELDGELWIGRGRFSMAPVRHLPR